MPEATADIEKEARAIEELIERLERVYFPGEGPTQEEMDAAREGMDRYKNALRDLAPGEGPTQEEGS